MDLGAGYEPGDWPAPFVQETLARVAADFAGRPDAPACLARPDGQEAAFPIGPARPEAASTQDAGTQAAGPVTVAGPPAALLAWLIGRDSGAGLAVTGAAAVPVLPSWR